MSESFFPATFSLSDGPVTAVETSPVDPKVRMDSTGFFATNPTGIKVSEIDATGSGYFTGNLLLLEGVQGEVIRPGATPGAAIQWTDGGGGLVAQISDTHKTVPPPGTISDWLTLQLGGLQSSSETAQLLLELFTQGGNNPNGNASVSALVTDAVGNSQNRTIIDAEGNSNFLQLVTIGNRKVSIGTASLNFPGSTISNLLTIPHGLGVVPIAFNYFSEAPSDNIVDAIVANYTAPPDVNNIYIHGRTVSGAAIGPGTTPGRWIAMG